MWHLIDHVAASATGGDFTRPLDEVLEAYAAFGYRRFEVYSDGRASALDFRMPPEFYVQKAIGLGLTFSSMHLSVIRDDMVEADFARAVSQAMYARDLGIKVVVFKAHTKAVYIEQGVKFLDAVCGHGIVPVIQIHEGGAFNDLDDLLEVFRGIDDPRMKFLLEVGTLHAFGIVWKQACDVLQGRIALVHVKDMVGRQSVPYGAGEVDIPGLFRQMRQHGYEGDFVIEIDPADKENTRRYISEALAYLRKHCS